MQYLLLAEGPGAGFAGNDTMLALAMLAVAGFLAAHIVPLVSLYYAIRRSDHTTRIIAWIIFIVTASPLLYVWWWWAEAEGFLYFM